MGGDIMIVLDFKKYSLSDIINNFTTDLAQTSYGKMVLAFLKEWNTKKDSFIIKSSGTTGPIKEIDFTRASLVQSAKITLKAFDLTEDSILISALPLSFVAGKMMLVRAIIANCKVLLFEPKANPIEKLKIRSSFAAFTPYQLQHILQESPDKLALIDTVIIGGSKVDSKLSDILERLDNRYFETFGMSETLTHVAIRPINGVDMSEYFTMLDGFSFTVNDDQCLQIKAAHLGESSIITTDIVEQINERQFLWLGRIDNVVNTGGVKVYPENIERKLLNDIDEAFIISKVDDDLLGEKVILVIESEKHFSITDFDFSALSKFETPKEVHIVKQLPRNNNGKIIRLNTNE